MPWVLNAVCIAWWLVVVPVSQLPGSKPPGPAAPPTVGTPKKPLTDAERITSTRQSIERSRATIERLQKQLDDPQAEYRKAEAEFADRDKQLKDAPQKIAELRKAGQTAQATELEASLPRLTDERELAKDRFDIAIRKQKATREAIANLKDRVTADEETLAALEGKAPPAAPPTAAPAQPRAAAPPPVIPKPAPAPPPAPAPVLPTPALPGLPALPETTAPAAAQTTADPAATADQDPALRQALEDVEAAGTRLRDAEARQRLTEERVRTMERSIKGIGQMVEIERAAAAQAETAAARIAELLRTAPPPDPAERQALADRKADADRRTAEARDRVRRMEDRLGVLKETLGDLTADVETAKANVQARREDVGRAETAVRDLTSPLATRNLFRWAREHGPALLVIVVGTLLLHLLVRQFSRQIVRLVARNSHRGSPEDRENRASTLVGVFRYAGGLAIFGGGFVMLLDEVGVPVVPLMGGAAVLGLAVAFGAQNLIRDYFSGFMMLLEDQYSVNDVVRIGPIAGLVELITLRVTVLRDLEGVRHFIPHGSITGVSNLTHGWSRAMLDVPVAYKENVDQVMGVLRELGSEMRSHPDLGRHILEEPEMLGVDALGDSGVVIKFLVKTRPLQQWPVKRELLRRIKNRFDELGIEIPFPHRTVYHRGLNEAGETGPAILRNEPYARAG